MMGDAWGPFARQCITTRLSHDRPNGHLSPIEEDKITAVCFGFATLPRSDGSVEITASMNAADSASNLIVSRILRYPSGISRPAQANDTGLLAYGSDVPDVADTLARDIGLKHQQQINPDEQIAVPIRLRMPSPVDVTLVCQPSGEAEDHGRKVLLLNCTLDQDVTNDLLRAHLHLAGTQRVDVATGVRLSGSMSGWLNGQTRQHGDSPWVKTSDDHIWYSKWTEFE
jgi:hypothetical protein